MTGTKGFSLQDRDGGTLGVGLEKIAEDRWRLDQWVEREGDEPGSFDLPNRVGSLDVAWLLQNDEAHLAAASIPHLKSKETARAVAGWIAREEEGLPEQWSSTWMERGDTDGNAETRNLILLYAEHEKIQAGLDRAAAWSLQPGRALPRFAALDRFFRMAGPRQEDLESWNLVFLGRESSFLCIATADCMLMTRPLPADHSDGSEQAEYVERLSTEVSRSLFFARQAVGSPEVQRIIVCGDDELAPMLVSQLQENHQTSSAYWDLAAHFDTGGRDVPVDAYVNLAAAALGGLSGDVNLLAEEAPGRISPRLRRRLVLSGLAAAFVLTPLVWITAMTASDLQEEYLASGRRQLRRAEGQAREAEKLYREHQVFEERRALVEDYRHRGRDLDQVLLRLAEMAPPAVTFRDLRIVETDHGGLLLSLTGESRDPSAERAQQSFLDFLEALEGSELLGHRGEPRELEISRPEGAQNGDQQVLFSLDYDLPAEVGGREG